MQINENVIYKNVIALWMSESKSFRGAKFSGWLRLYPFKQILRKKSFYETFSQLTHMLSCFLKESWPNIICPFLSDSKLALWTAVISWLCRGLWIGPVVLFICSNQVLESVPVGECVCCWDVSMLCLVLTSAAVTVSTYRKWLHSTGPDF